MFFSILQNRPMRLYFEFRKARKPTANAAGIIYAKIKLSDQVFGPMTTGINTTRKVWDRRFSHSYLPESKALNAEIGEFSALCEAAQLLLIQEKLSATPQIIFRLAVWLKKRWERTGESPIVQVTTPGQQSEFRQDVTDYLKGVKSRHSVTIVKVYEEFLTLGSALINDDRYSRHGEQVSSSTITLYEYYFGHLKTYLIKTDQLDLPIREVTIVLGNSFKEYLITLKKSTGKPLSSTTVRNILSFFKHLCDYAIGKGYLSFNPIQKVRPPRSVAPNPQPLTAEQRDYLETVELSGDLRAFLDSFLLAGELCLHYADFMELPRIEMQATQDGTRYFVHTRVKQRGKSQIQTVHVTARAERILAKYGSTQKLRYGTYQQFYEALLKISLMITLRDSDGKPIRLVFGRGRDSGITERAMSDMPMVLVQASAGHASTNMLKHYVKAGEQALKAYLENQKKDN